MITAQPPAVPPPVTADEATHRRALPHDELDVAVGRVCSAEMPTPDTRDLEEAALPRVEDIVPAVRGVVR